MKFSIPHKAHWKREMMVLNLPKVIDLTQQKTEIIMVTIGHLNTYSQFSCIIINPNVEKFLRIKQT